MRIRTALATALFPDFDVFSNQKWEKRFAPSVTTIGHWQNGTMDHEWLFRDNQDSMNQLGLGTK